MRANAAKDNVLFQIASYLIMKASNVRDIGLYHGKMGIVCSLYSYSFTTGNKCFEDYAWDLFQDVYSGVYESMPLGVENGLAGVGCGVIMINQMLKMDTNLNDVLWEIDKKIMLHDPRRMTDMSFRSGALGLWSYITMRKKFGILSSIDEVYQKELGECIINNNAVENTKTIMDDIAKPSWEASEYQGKAMGIDAGMAYYLLKT